MREPRGVMFRAVASNSEPEESQDDGGPDTFMPEVEMRDDFTACHGCGAPITSIWKRVIDGEGRRWHHDCQAAALRAEKERRAKADDSPRARMAANSGIATGRSSEFRDLSRLTTTLKVALGITIALDAVGLWSGWLELDLLNRAANGALVSEAEATANDSRQSLIGITQVIWFVVTAVVFLRWTYFSNRNARSLSDGALQFSPGWAVGWYFIPIANLWKPYQALEETFKASDPKFLDDWRKAERPRIMALWWTLWILSRFVGQLILRTSLRAETIDELLSSSWLTFFLDVLDIALAFVVIVLASTLHTWQLEKHRRVRLTAATGV